jgi:predicted transposase YbfD/YdcC
MAYGSGQSNGITAIPELFDRLDMRGVTISLDATGCRTDRTAKIREQEADEVLPVKENRPTAYRRQMSISRVWSRTGGGTLLRT